MMGTAGRDWLLAHPGDGGDATAANRRLREGPVRVRDDQLVQPGAAKSCWPLEPKHLSGRDSTIREEEPEHAVHSHLPAGRVPFVGELNPPVHETEAPTSSEVEGSFLATQETGRLRDSGAEV